MGVSPYAKTRKGWVVRGSVVGMRGVEVNTKRLGGRPKGFDVSDREVRRGGGGDGVFMDGFC